jgi:PAS domain S-box-containing protein
VAHLNKRLDELMSENSKLRARLEESEELVEAIRHGRVDAVVVSKDEGDVVYTLKGADYTYRVLIETMDEGAVILSEEGTVLYCNRRFADMLGKPLSTLTGGSLRGFFVAEDEGRFGDLLQRVLANEGLKTELRFKTAGADMPSLVGLTPLQLDEMKGVCMVVTDLSALKRSEETLRAYSERLFRKNAELKLRAEQLARMSAELTMTEQRERKRLSKILHDGLQQHLAAAKLQLGVLAHQISPEDLQETLFEIEEMLAESIRIARSLSTDLSPPILHAAGIAAALEWLGRWMTDMHDFKVDLDLETQEVQLNDDIKILVFEAVRELLFNAVKHAGVGRGAIRLETLAGSRIKIVVSDKGKGFDACGLQLPRGNEGGLGLFSIRERIGIVGGSFEMESDPGKGSRFTLIVPQSIEVAELIYPDFEQSEKPQDCGEGDDSNQLVRVLLADDHTLFRDGIARLLNKEPNIQVVGHAPNGRVAIELSQKLNPHVILMDVSMPDIDGIQATRIIHQQAPHIRIIGLSMYEDDERSQVMREAGAVGYKSKTCPAAELIEAVLPNSGKPAVA